VGFFKVIHSTGPGIKGERKKSFSGVAKEIILDIAAKKFYFIQFLPLVSLSLYHFFKIIF
jgi:hypothetical protein